MEGYRLPPIMFTESEANALVTAEQLILKNKDASFVKHYTEAITKVKSVLRYDTKDKVNLLSNRVAFFQNDNYVRTSDSLSAIQSALTNFNLTIIQYHSADKNETTLRTIEPFALYNSTEENWLLIAWCRLRKDFRTFRLDRIKKIEIRNDKFEQQKITLQEYMGIIKNKILNP